MWRVVKPLFVMSVVVAGVSGLQAEVIIDTVEVGHAGNAPDTRFETAGVGAVGYEYSIGKYEVTAGQYTEFLNAVAATDTYGLYSSNMWSHGAGCKIQRAGSPGSYTYSIAADRVNRPVNYVSWGDAARFVNWLHNGQPTGPQGAGTTESGTYDLNGATGAAELMAVTRQPGATWALPTEDEWYKPAFHYNNGPTGDYYGYPTATDETPSNALIDPDPGNNGCFYNGGFTIGAPYYLTPVGEFENSGSPYGTFDQGGNLKEWNESISEGYRGKRGGCYLNPAYVLHASESGYGNPAAESYDGGFRVVLVPEPASVGMVLLGMLLLGRRR